MGTDYWVATFSGDTNNAAVTSGPTAEAVNVDTIGTSQTPTAAYVGQSISDTATVTGLVSPDSGDTVTFRLYDNNTGSGTPLYTSSPVTVTISGSTATATAPGYTTTSVGTDYWVATFSGDTNNAAVTSGPTAEAVNVDTISTSQTPTAAYVGQSISDTATVTGLVSPDSGDTVTFRLYDDNTGSGTPLYTSSPVTVTISGSTATATAPGYTTTSVGTDYWVATFSGDTNNAAVTSGPTAEAVNVDTISTSQTPTAAYVGQSISDTATVTGLVSPDSGDTVTFRLYDNNTGSGTPLYTSSPVTVTISGSTATAAAPGYTTTSVGTDYWVATFSGDTNNAAVSSGPTAEAVNVDTISTSQTPTAAYVGQSISDTATVTGLVSPDSGDTVTFRLYDNNTGSGTPLYTSSPVTVTISGSTATATAPGYTTTSVGTDYWVATFSGDTNNAAVSSGPTAEAVNVDTISTSQTPTAAYMGQSISDTATVTGLVSPDSGDTVTFRLYDNNTGSGTPLYTSSPVTVTISGSTATATAPGYTTTSVGTDYWVATFSGDTNNAAVSSGPTAEAVNVDTISTSQTPTAAYVGQSISDTATVTGLVSPDSGDTVTFRLYDNNTGSGAPLYTSSPVTVTISGSTATATAPGYTTTSVGTDYWVATFSGDTNNAGVSSGPTAEAVNVDTISTSQTPTAAYVGQSISDTATVTGLVSPDSGDTVTFRLYDNNTGSGTPLYTSSPVTVTISGSTATATAPGYTTTSVGTDYWVASFSGDTNNAAVTSGPTAEAVNVDTISTSQTPTAAYVGESISDAATVTGLVSPDSGDTVTFRLYDNNTASGTPLYTSSPVTVTISGSSATATAPGYTTTAVGTDYWVASFSGDTNNAAVSSGPTAEAVNVDTISTSQTPTAAYVGQSISDTATVTGLVSPDSGDTVTFRLYDNNTASGTPLYTSSPVTVTINGSTATATAPGYTTTAAGTDYWVASFSGDTNNAAVSSGPAAEAVNVQSNAIVIGMDKSPLTSQSVEVIDPNTGTVLTQFVPYSSNFQGGVRVATGDLGDNGIDDIVTVPGRGGLPVVHVYSATGTLLTEFQAYPSSVDGGLQVAVADVTGDGLPDIITVPSYGPAEVRVFKNLGLVNGVPTFDSTPYLDFLAFPSSFIGGASIAAAGVGSTPNGDAEIIVGSGAGMAATVEVFDVSSLTTTSPAVQATPLATFNPFSTSTMTFYGGVSLAVAQFTANSLPDIVVGAGAGGQSMVEVWGWNSGTDTLAKLAGAGEGFAAFTDPSSNAPIQLTTLSNANGIANAIVVVQGPGGTTNQVVEFDVLSSSPLTLSSAKVVPGEFIGPYTVAAINLTTSSSSTSNGSSGTADADPPTSISATSTALPGISGLLAIAPSSVTTTTATSANSSTPISAATDVRAASSQSDMQSAAADAGVVQIASNAAAPVTGEDEESTASVQVPSMFSLLAIRPSQPSSSSDDTAVVAAPVASISTGNAAVNQPIILTATTAGVASPAATTPAASVSAPANRVTLATQVPAIAVVQTQANAVQVPTISNLLGISLQGFLASSQADASTFAAATPPSSSTPKTVAVSGSPSLGQELRPSSATPVASAQIPNQTAAAAMLSTTTPDQNSAAPPQLPDWFFAMLADA